MKFQNRLGAPKSNPIRGLSPKNEPIWLRRLGCRGGCQWFTRLRTLYFNHICTFCSPILSLFSLLLSIPVRFSFRSQSVKRVTLIFDFLSTLVFDNLSLFIYLSSIIIIIHFMHLVLHGVSEPCPYLEFFSNMTNFSNKSSRWHALQPISNGRTLVFPNELLQWGKKCHKWVGFISTQL